MSKEFVIETITQPSMYDPIPRKIPVYFSTPDNINCKLSGIVLLIEGFGGHSRSNVFIKMRKLFADEYNMITVQCDYFGWEFMQSEKQKESPSNFCDLGPVQAMDNLIALKAVINYLEEQSITFNRNNIIAYGFSHGAYLAYLMNAFMPNVLSCIIDNSSWIYPLYLSCKRILLSSNKRLEFDYLISKIVMDSQIYDLNFLYRSLNNTCHIISFHGMDDHNVAPIADKISFSSTVKNMSIELISKSRVDNIRFRSTDHGLDADFIELFAYVMSNYHTESRENVLSFEDRVFNTQSAEYSIENEYGIPILFYSLKTPYDFNKLSEYV